MKGKIGLVFVVVLVVGFILLNLLVFDFNEHVVDVSEEEQYGFRVESLVRESPEFIYNDSIIIAKPYYLDYTNRRKLFRKKNTLSDWVEIDDSIFTLANPQDTIYLLKQLDTMVFLNLYR